LETVKRLKLGLKELGALAVLAVSFAGTLLHAQGYEADKPMGMAAQQMPAYLAHAGIEQRLGQPLPMAALFTDETGRTGPLSSWFSDKPVVMAEVYYQCAMMCPQVQHGLATGLAQTTLKPGSDYQVLVVSIDTMDKPANAVDEKKTFLSDPDQTARWTSSRIRA